VFRDLYEHRVKTLIEVLDVLGLKRETESEAQSQPHV
jgi:hypothetical protein